MTVMATRIYHTLLQYLFLDWALSFCTPPFFLTLRSELHIELSMSSLSRTGYGHGRLQTPLYPLPLPPNLLSVSLSIFLVITLLLCHLDTPCRLAKHLIPRDQKKAGLEIRKQGGIYRLGKRDLFELDCVYQDSVSNIFCS